MLIKNIFERLRLNNLFFSGPGETLDIGAKSVSFGLLKGDGEDQGRIVLSADGDSVHLKTKVVDITGMSDVLEFGNLKTE